MLYLVKLKFLSPVHFGKVGIGIENSEEILHSDSLFSALCHAWGILYGKTELGDLLQGFDGALPFLLSSGFLYRGDTFFLPKPLCRSPGFEDVGIREKFGRDMKKTKYLPLEVFERWVKGLDIAYESLKESYPRYQDGFNSFLTPRVALDRMSSNSELFQCGLVQFREGAGLYFLVRIEDDEILRKMGNCLGLSGETGLGGERTYGYGRFEAEFPPAGERWERLFEERGDCVTTLSLYHPEVPPAEVIGEASYDLQERGGWIHSPFWKKQFKRKTVVMFREGSVFKSGIKGHLVDVTPSIWDRDEIHPIYRYGYALTVPLSA